jgi:hypothetical protein
MDRVGRLVSPLLDPAHPIYIYTHGDYILN